MFVAMLAAACCLGVSGTPETTAPDVNAYLAGHAIPLKSVNAGNGFGDLKPLAKVFKDVRLVSLGEATHGTREFFQLKHRLLEYLVEKRGFNAFGIESSYVGCLPINDYVMYGKGDAAQALAGQKFWTWDTQEVTEMIEWMRRHNSKLPEKKRIRFLGFDMQVSGYDVSGVIEGYVKKVSPDDLPQVQSALGTNAETAQLQALLDFLARNRDRFVQRSSREEFDTVMQHARVLFQNRESKDVGPDGKRMGSRDRYMAQNIRDLMESLGPKTRMVVWAHNAHISNRKSESNELMGSYLRQWYGRQYYVLGLIFNQGSFQVMVAGEKGYALGEVTLPAAPEGSVPWYFAHARTSDYLIDFRSAPADGPFAEWLLQPHPMVSIGSTFSHDRDLASYMKDIVPGKEYDGMAFIEKTTRARPTPTGLRPAPK